MESPLMSPGITHFQAASTSRTSLQRPEDTPCLTSFNPFSEEDENDQSSYALVTSLLSRVKNTFAPTSAIPSNQAPPNQSSSGGSKEGSTSEPQRRASLLTQNSNVSSRSGPERPTTLHRFSSSRPAPPLVSLTPVTSEVPSFNLEYDRPPSSRGFFSSSVTENGDAPGYGVAIPGFPIQDSDARSIRTTISVNRQGSVSKTMRRIRGEGLSRDYWMDDELCKECYDCKSVFTAWRRKHHCRICGQVFCSRCASNIIKGSRYGHDGMIRVCNLCLEKVSKVEDDDEDDRRSVVSSTASPFATHHPSDPYSLVRYSNSPFSTSQAQITNPKPDAFNLFSIAESKRGSESLHSPVTSADAPHDQDGYPVHSTAVPFRRNLSSDEAEPIRIPGTGHERNLSAQSLGLPVEFPITVPVSGGGAISTIAFPGSPQEHAPDSADDVRSRINSSYGDFDGSGTPFVRSRVQSRIPDNFGPEPGWRTRRESTAYAQELNLVSMFHLRIMLRQMLTKEEIPNITEWETTLLKLALQMARDLTFTAHPQRQGADMDVRRYVKIKKIPGGSPKDSEFVDGAVITKNVAHKAMSRSQRNPRVMLVTFPLEFHRVEGQYMHFGQVVRQEKEYLNNLAARIAALRPHIVLVEKSVSRIVLDALAKHKIGVARSVKESAIQFVARMIQGDVFSSIDRLALEPRLGHCANFQIQTFDHQLIPGRRKTYMRFEGCNKEMGCTILLRGGDSDTLMRIKRVTRFLTFIVRNLKLETHLWMDSVIALPQLTAEAVPSAPTSDPSNPTVAGLHPSLWSFSNLKFISDSPLSTSDTPDPQIDDEDLPDDEAQQRTLTRKIQQSLDPYTKTFISVSATLRFQPPYPIQRMKELDDALTTAKRSWEDEIIRREEKTGTPVAIMELPTVSETDCQADTPTEPVPYHFQEVTITPNVDEDDIKAQIESLPDRISSETPEILPNGNGYFDTTPPLSTEVKPRVFEEAVPCMLRTTEDIGFESRIAQLKGRHEEQRKIWEWYLRRNKDDFVVEKYQCITLWECAMPIADYGSRKACTQPQLKYVTFYGENDLTLGQFIESSINDTLAQSLDPKMMCTAKGCGEPVARHCKVFVHNDTKLMVAVDQWDQGHGGAHYLCSSDLVATWSSCRLCGMVTPFIVVSEEMQRYSFAKFLELHLYPADVQFVEGAGCQHNIYKYHIRYFSRRGMAVRFQTDPVNVFEVVFPPSRIIVRPESRLELKNADFTRLHNRNTLWYTALIGDLKLINIDAAIGDEEADQNLTTDINALILRAEMENDEITRMINHVYKDTGPTDTLGLNQVRAYRQDKIVAWQQDFDRLPKVRPQMSRKSSAFGSVRAGLWPGRRDFPGPSDHISSASVSEAEELAPPPLHRKVTGLSLISMSSTSDASEPEMDGAISRLVGKVTPLVVATANGVVRKEHDAVKPVPEEGNDGDSDSTIGAAKEDTVPELSVSYRVEKRKEPLESPPTELAETTEERVSRPISRLPRRITQHPSVAELVKRYQEFLPASGVSDLAKTALAPDLPESDPEISSPPLRPLPRPRNRSRHRVVSKKTSVSDFEQGYAANVAPRQRRSLTSRIPVPPPPLDLHSDSRRTSPDKRPSMSRGYTYDNPKLSPVVTGNRTRSRSYQKGPTKDKPPIPRSPAPGGKTTFRRQPAPGSKVSNIAKHFERISRDNERSTRRYTVIRGGRKPRPVASARAKVEILDSVRDAVQDEESESSSESSEADDEGECEEEAPVPAPKKSDSMNSTISRPGTEPEVAPITESPVDTEAIEAPPSSGAIQEPTGNSVVPPLRRASEAVESVVPSASTSPTVFTTPLPPSSRPPTSYVPADTDTGASERGSIFRALTGFWPGQAPQSRFRSESDVEDLVADPEHIFRDASMVVRTDEPTSIIALALNSPLYREMLTKSRAEKRIAREPRVANDSNEVFMPDDNSVAESASTWGVVQVDSVTGGDPTEDLRMPSSKLPWAVSFESSGLTITCTILYPEQFDALRRTYDCEKSLIESLARCVKFNASGGKSGSAFLKTKDDRFIAKEISRAELATMETFAPTYFDYMSSCFTAGRPTLLAKIFGCFKVTWKTTSHSGPGKPKANQLNLVVMENLFYDRRFSKIYDLKGSTRGRHVQSTGKENEVLLDENLNETAHLSPFFLREHSKRILRGALNSDSKFLADINVMDYSFVVGVDSARNELVVGIVDYVRTYTLDKKLESLIKESAFLGGAGKGEPTIITPRQYRHRFLTAMERYFPLTPDRWMKQQDVPEYDVDW